MRGPIDIAGLRFCSLVAVKCVGKIDKSGSLWEFACDCGALAIIRSADVKSGKTRSCGCRRKNVSRTRLTKHGQTGTGVYASWQAMLRRCTNPNTSEYKDYGGRGISVCTAWVNSFEQFHRDMGDRPIRLTLDRIDVNKNYEPGNCRWATRKEQSNNRRPRKLSVTDVLEIRSALLRGVKQKTLAVKFGVTQSNISQVKRRCTFRMQKDNQYDTSKEFAKSTPHVLGSVRSAIQANQKPS